MEFVGELDNRNIDCGGEWRLERLPTPEEAALIRKIFGLRKSPNLSDERKEALKQYLKLGSERKADRPGYESAVGAS